MINIFLYFSLTPIFKKLDAFIPALPLLLNQHFCVVFLFMFHKQPRRNVERLTNPCVFLFIILYIVNVCFFEWFILCFLLAPIFKKLDAFIPALSLLGLASTLFIVFCFPQKTTNNVEAENQPLCVSFYYIILLVTTCTSPKIIFHPPKN